MPDYLVHKSKTGIANTAEWQETDMHQFQNQEQGDIPFAIDSTKLSRLAHGLSGQPLVSGGNGANPSWGYMPNRNAIINGSMDIWQRGTTTLTAPTTNTYFPDRWQVNYILTHGVCNLERSTDVPTVAESSMKFNYSLKCNITTAQTDTAFSTDHISDYMSFHYHVEGYDIKRFMGQPCTLSFWVKSPKAGVHSVSFQCSSNNYIYLASYTVNSANTWEKKTITFTFANGDTGTWLYTNGLGCKIVFILAGAYYVREAANAFYAADNFCCTDQVNCLDSTDNNFYLTGVQLELGSVATPFEYRPYGQELALCQRYYEKSYDQGVDPGTASAPGKFQIYIAATGASAAGASIFYKVSKRVAATVVFYAPSTGTINKLSNGGGADTDTGLAQGGQGENGFYVYLTDANAYGHFTATAEL